MKLNTNGVLFAVRLQWATLYWFVKVVALAKPHLLKKDSALALGNA